MEKKVAHSDLFRYERKFVIPKMMEHRLISFLSNSKLCFSEIYKERTINNIYLDTHDYKFFFENVDGISDRKKVRIRWYGNLEKALKPNLEFKIKSGNVGTKKIFNLNDFYLYQLNNYSKLSNYFKKSNSVPHEIKLYLKCLFPVLINTYTRRYYESGNKIFRVTIDKSMKYSQFFNFSGPKRMRKQESLIMEVKYQNNLNMESFLNYFFPFNITKNSKYVFSLTNSLY